MTIPTDSRRLAARAGFVLGLLLMPQMSLLLVLAYWSATWFEGRPPFPALLLPFLLPLVPLAGSLAFWLQASRRPMPRSLAESDLELPRLRPAVAVLMALLPAMLPLPAT